MHSLATGVLTFFTENWRQDGSHYRILVFRAPFCSLVSSLLQVNPFFPCPRASSRFYEVGPDLLFVRSQMDRTPIPSTSRPVRRFFDFLIFLLKGVFFSLFC